MSSNILAGNLQISEDRAKQAAAFWVSKSVLQDISFKGHSNEETETVYMAMKTLEKEKDPADEPSPMDYKLEI